MEKVTVAQVFAQQEKIKQLSEERDKVKETMSTEIGRVQDKYRDQIWDLEHKRNEDVHRLEEARDAFVKGMDLGISIQYRVIGQARQILEYFRVPKQAILTIGDPKMSQYAEQYVESLGYLLDDDMLKVKIFIVGNRKPKNKYTLAAIGRSVFGEPLIKFPQSYGLEISFEESRHNSLEMILRDAATPAELKDYFNYHLAPSHKNIPRLSEVIEEYRKLRTDYAEAMQNYRLEEFGPLLTWHCPHCNNFRTIFEDESRDTPPQCYRHDPYENMVKTVEYETTLRLQNKI